ncbi:MAG: GNAT family N-acetyltransferase [Actinomycetes bacterium]
MTSNDDRRPTYPVRTLGDDDWPGFLDTDSHAFGSTMPAEITEFERGLLEDGRSIGAFDGPTPVGIATAFSFELTVPGSVVPAAGVSWVGVLPTHRRRGVLSSLMTHQLHAVHALGREPLAVLWASEPQIYGRFGYGLASRAYSLKVPRSVHALRTDVPSDGTVRLRLAPADDWKVTAPVYDEVARSRPGMLRRDERWWQRAVRDLPSMREGRSELRCVIAEDDEGVRGYARYTTKPDWSTNQPQGVVFVQEVLATDPAARAALYRYLFDLDLMATTELWNVPVDEPLLHWLQNIRAASPRWQDRLYVRLVDVAAALRARRYTTAVDVVLEITDPLCPWNDGRWHLIADDGGVRCEHTDRQADLDMSVTDLGAAYLGGTLLADLALAGRVEERTRGALPAASAAFLSSPAPWCPIVF